MALSITCSDCDEPIQQGEEVYCENCRTVMNTCSSCKNEVAPEDINYCQSCYDEVEGERNSFEDQLVDLQGKVSEIQEDYEEKIERLETDLASIQDNYDELLEFLNDEFPDAVMAYNMIHSKIA